MKRITLMLTCLAGLLCFTWAAAAAQTLWVTSDQADLKADSSSTSETVATLARGTELNVKATDNRWYEVSTKAGESGWVYRGKVSETAPEIDASAQQSDPGLGDLLGGLSGSSIETDAASTSRSIRGLSPEAVQYADQTHAPEDIRKALDEVLSYGIKDNEIDRFLKDGRIGEYAQ